MEACAFLMSIKATYVLIFSFILLQSRDEDGDATGFTSRPKRALNLRCSQGRMKRANQSKNQQPLSCKHCRKTSTELLQLKAHQDIHGANMEKLFQCSTCGRGFPFQRSLDADFTQAGVQLYDSFLEIFFFLSLSWIHKLWTPNSALHLG